MPAPFILYHNPRCSKSRSAFDLLQERGIEAEVVRYLDTPPDLAALQDIFRKLGLESARLDNAVRLRPLPCPEPCHLYSSPDPRDRQVSRLPASPGRTKLVTPDQAAIRQPP